MLQLASTDLGFSLGRNLGVHVGYILLNQDVISFMSAEGLTTIGTQEGTQLVILSCSLNLTLVHLLFLAPLHYQFRVDLIIKDL